MQEKFLSMMENLPSTIHNQIKKDITAPQQSSNQSQFQQQNQKLQHRSRSDRLNDSIQRKNDKQLETVTWKNLSISKGLNDTTLNTLNLKSRGSERYNLNSTQNFTLNNFEELNRLDNGGSNSFDLSRNDSTDHLITAILDGDIQGIRSIIRSRGESLQSEYWKDQCISILPLHRAIAGLHFHGNGSILIHTIETLIQLGANVNSQDSAGNSPLHKVYFIYILFFFSSSSSSPSFFSPSFIF